MLVLVSEVGVIVLGDEYLQVVAGAIDVNTTGETTVMPPDHHAELLTRCHAPLDLMMGYDDDKQASKYRTEAVD